MSTFVEECRREWKRLGVPDSIADEMATDLEADLEEAQADGVSSAEMIGESDPRRFAATWASERGLVSEQPPQQKRRRLRFWVGLAVALVLMFFLVLLLVGGLFATATVSLPSAPHAPPPVTIASVRIPDFVGLNACHAERIALEGGLRIQTSYARGLDGHRCAAVVVAQKPAAGTIVPQHTPQAHATLTLRLRG